MGESFFTFTLNRHKPRLRVACFLSLVAGDYFHRLPKELVDSLVTIIIASSDTIITLVFGVLSTIISLLGIFIGYLTLRAMALENSMHSSSALPSSTFIHTLIVPSHIVNKPNPLIKGSNLRDLEHRRIHRHQHTHIITPRYNFGELEENSTAWED
jgi:uncharacterized membrane protein